MTRLPSESLDAIFLALGHPIRRQMLARLSAGEVTVTEIAVPFQTSLNAISKHLKVLENAGLIQRQIVGREHRCRLQPESLQDAANWLAYHQEFWRARMTIRSRSP